jgi:hypothetical protein
VTSVSPHSVQEDEQPHAAAVATEAVDPAEDTGAPEEPAAPVEPPRYMRRGKCDTGRPLCGKTARWYAAGWRCDEHRPTSR